MRLAPVLGWDARATWWRAPASGDADWIHADVRDPEAMRTAAAGIDAVIHTAYRQSEEARSTNVEGTRSVASAARGARLIHVSTDLVFDGSRGRYREDDEVAPVSDYGRSKAEAEAIVAMLHPAAAIVRTSLLYGGATPGPQERLARSGRRFFVDELRSPIQVGDLAAALLELVDTDHAGPLHVAGPDDVSRYDFAVLLGADPEQIEAAHTSPDRAPDVTLDSSRAMGMLSTRLRGVREVLGG